MQQKKTESAPQSTPEEPTLAGKRTLRTQIDGHRCGFVAIVGMPNAGKSTLMNRFLGEKLSIVSHLPQTTRSTVTCILSSDDYQVIFIDTPGILTPKYRMQEVMSSYVQSAFDESDAVLLLLDASTFRHRLPGHILSLADTLRRKKVVVGLNKIDILQKKTSLLEVIAAVAVFLPDVEIVPLSARTGEGADELLAVLLDMLPAGPKLFPDDQLSTEPERFFVAELIREAVFLTMEEEIPYASGVIIEQFDESGSATVIHASILVEKESQKPMVIGKGGSRIRDIGIRARRGIEQFLDRSVYLDLRVKVREDWRNRDVFLRETGLTR